MPRAEVWLYMLSQSKTTLVVSLDWPLGHTIVGIQKIVTAQLRLKLTR